MSGSSPKRSPGRQPGEDAPASGRKRTVAISLLALGAGAVTIGVYSGGAGSGNRTFQSVESCEAERKDNSYDCKNNFTQALNSHERSAPAFANREACEKQVEWSMAMVTSLNPLIGYDQAAALAKEAFKVGKTVRQLCLDKIKAGTLKKKESDQVVQEAELTAALNPRSMTEPDKV